MSQSQNQPTYNRKDLKIQALLEKLSQQESQIADLRVELTVLENQIRELMTPQPAEAPIMPMHAGDIVQGHAVENPQPQENPEAI